MSKYKRILIMAAKSDDKVKLEVENFIKLLSVFVAYDNELDLPPRNNIQDWIYKCNDFLKKYSDAKVVKLLLQMIVRDVTGEKWENAMYKLGTVVKDTVDDVFEDNEVPSQYISLLKDLGLYLRNQSLPAYNRIIKGISYLKDSNVNKVFVQKVDVKQSSVVNRLKNIVKKLTGKEDIKIDAATCKIVKEKKPELYKDYLATRREVLDVYKKTLANIIRSSGKEYLPVEKVLKILGQKGILVHNIPRGFEGNIGDDGSLYTIAGKHITGIPLGSVVMNPNYDANKDNGYVFSSDGDGTFATSQRYYTDDYKIKSRTEKMQKVKKFSSKLDGIRTKWINAIKRWTGDASSVAALMLEIAYQTAARIGSGQGSTAGKETYGLSTWQLKHITIKPNEVIIKYRGKKGMPQKHILKGTDTLSKLVIKHIKELAQNKDNSDYLFTDDNDRRVSSVIVNQYLKKLGSPVTIHKIRHAKGNKMLGEIINSNPFSSNKKKPEPKEVESWLKSNVEKIAKTLGHQSTDAKTGKLKTSVMTSINNYLDPQIIKDFYNGLNIHYPRWLEKLKTED